MGRKLLPNVAVSATWTTFVGALEGVLRALGEPRSTHELMGLTGHAFRIALTEEDGVVAAGPAARAVDFRRVLPLYRNVGRMLELLTSAPADRNHEKHRREALKRIRKSIDRGTPAIAYDIHIPEFGIIYGYDDRARTLAVSSLMSGQYGVALAESRWPVPERAAPLILFLVGKRVRAEPVRACRDALRFALEYAARGDPGDPTRAVHGLAAFSTWREALEQHRPIEPAGNARTIQTVQSARRDAARFLRDTASVVPTAAADLNEAAAAYDAVALALSRMATLFPYPTGGEVDSRGARMAAAAALREAEAQERQAVTLLRSTIEVM